MRCCSTWDKLRCTLAAGLFRCTAASQSGRHQKCPATGVWPCPKSCHARVVHGEGHGVAKAVVHVGLRRKVHDCVNLLLQARGGVEGQGGEPWPGICIVRADGREAWRPILVQRAEPAATSGHPASCKQTSPAPPHANLCMAVVVPQHSAAQHSTARTCSSTCTTRSDDWMSPLMNLQKGVACARDQAASSAGTHTAALCMHEPTIPLFQAHENQPLHGQLRAGRETSRGRAPSPHTAAHPHSLEVGCIAHGCQVVQGGAVVELVQHHHLHRRAGACSAAGAPPPGGGANLRGGGPPRCWPQARSARPRIPSLMIAAPWPIGGGRRPSCAATTPVRRALHPGCCCTSLMTTQLAMKPASGGRGRASGGWEAPPARSSFQACRPRARASPAPPVTRMLRGLYVAPSWGAAAACWPSKGEVAVIAAGGARLAAWAGLQGRGGGASKRGQQASWQLAGAGGRSGTPPRLSAA